MLRVVVLSSLSVLLMVLPVVAMSPEAVVQPQGSVPETPGVGDAAPASVSVATHHCVFRVLPGAVRGCSMSFPQYGYITAFYASGMFREPVAMRYTFMLEWTDAQNYLVFQRTCSSELSVGGGVSPVPVTYTECDPGYQASVYSVGTQRFTVTATVDYCAASTCLFDGYIEISSRT